MTSTDWTVGGAVVTLTSDSNPNLVYTDTTGANGAYYFGNLPTGQYTLMLPQYSDLIAGHGTAGEFINASGNVVSLSSAVVTRAVTANQIAMNEITDINVQPGYAGIGFNFGELGLQADQVSKWYFLDSTLATSDNTYWVSGTPAAVPEPASYLLLAAAVGGGLIWWRRRRAGASKAARTLRPGAT
jgi:hypothetical protein